MKNYIPLTEGQKEELEQFNGMPFKGFITFFENGEEGKSTDLLEMSDGTIRLRTAEIIGVNAFDDYWILNDDETVRAKASDIKGLSISVDEQDYGKSEGFKYQRFLRRHEEGTCGNCGHKLGGEI